MKNQIVFPENCRLFEQQRVKLEGAFEVFPMDLIAIDLNGVVYPSLVFSKKSCSSMKQISGSLLTPDTESEFYTLRFNGDVRLETKWYNGNKRFWKYELFTGEKSNGTFMYSELWESRYPNIFPPSPLTFRVHLAVPLKKLMGVDGRHLFPLN